VSFLHVVREAVYSLGCDHSCGGERGKIAAAGLYMVFDLHNTNYAGEGGGVLF
jgi:hypothetical protein